MAQAKKKSELMPRAVTRPGTADQAGRHHHRAGFTLVELLAAMAVLAVLMLLCSDIFSAATRAWSLGNARVEGNAIGRTVSLIMNRELSQAVVSTTMVFRAEDRRIGTPPDYIGAASVYGRPDSQTYSVHFISMLGYSWDERTPEEMSVLHYFVREIGRGTPTNHYQLCRAEGKWNTNANQRGVSLSVYRGLNWLIHINNVSQNPTNTVFVENISAFKVMINGTNDSYLSDATSLGVNRHKLPYFVDIYLGVLNDADARKAALLSGADQINFVTRNERRLVQRVYFQNRQSIPAPTAIP